VAPSGRPRKLDAVAARIRAALDTFDLPSAAVAVARDGEIVWEEGFGWADRERRVPATPRTLYSLGSISKPVTATALMVLVERGLLSLDAPVNRYLAESPLRAWVGDASQATLRRLANHTAGLPLHYHYFYADEPEHPPRVEETIRRYGNIVTPPGERYQYANLGFGVLGHLIALASGRGYERFLRQEIFEPLALTRSSVWVAPELARWAAREYGADGVVYPRKTTDHPGAGSIYASVHDVVRFGMFHLKQPQRDQEPILLPATLDDMQTPTADTGENTGYGIGWTTSELACGLPTVGHEGGSGGVTTQLLLFPTRGVAVAVLTNTSRPNDYLPFEAALDAAATLLPELRDQLEEQRLREAGRPHVAPAPGPTRPDSLAGKWSGAVRTYEGDIPIELEAAATLRCTLGGRAAGADQFTSAAGRLQALFPLTLDTGDTRRRSHRVQLDLTVRIDTLGGAAIAIAPTVDEGGAPGRRLGFALAHWTELRREA